MTRKHTALAVLIALVAITAVPTAFAEIQNNGFGGQILIDAASELENGFTKYKAKMHEIITQVNFNTLAITELQNTSGSDNQVQVDQNSADIQTVNATVFALEYPISANINNIGINAADIDILFDHSQEFENQIFGQVSTEGILHDIAELQNAPITTPTIYQTSITMEGPDIPNDDLSVNCDSGDTVLSGGYGVDSSSSPTETSRPTPTNDGWFVEWANVSNGAEYTVYAVCMDITP